MRAPTWAGLSLSLALHAVILALALIHVHSHHHDPIQSTPQAMIVASLKVEPAKTPPTKNKSVRHQKHKQQQQKHRHHPLHHAQQAQQAHHSTHNNKLIQYLYQAIEKQQYYPAIERALKHQASISVRFLLTPNGDITQLQLRQKSPYPRLNQAARITVQKAAPFTHAHRYLKVAQWVDLNIHYH